MCEANGSKLSASEQSSLRGPHSRNPLEPLCALAEAYAPERRAELHALVARALAAIAHDAISVISGEPSPGSQALKLN